MIEDILKTQRLFVLSDYERQEQILKKYCEDKRILTFVETLMKGSNVSQYLSMLVYQISHYDINLRSSTWLEDLNSFIGNYFLDDFYFRVGWNLSWDGFGEDVEGLVKIGDIETDMAVFEYVSGFSQDPMILVQAAIDNQIGYKKFDIPIDEKIRMKAANLTWPERTYENWSSGTVEGLNKLN